MTKERIEIIRQSLIPFVKKKLLEINYEGLGNSDAKEFEKDLNEVLDLAIKELEIVEEFERAQIITGGRLNGRWRRLSRWSMRGIMTQVIVSLTCARLMGLLNGSKRMDLRDLLYFLKKDADVCLKEK